MIVVAAASVFVLREVLTGVTLSVLPRAPRGLLPDAAVEGKPRDEPIEPAVLVAFRNEPCVERPPEAVGFGVLILESGAGVSCVPAPGSFIPALEVASEVDAVDAFDAGIEKPPVLAPVQNNPSILRKL